MIRPDFSPDSWALSRRTGLGLALDIRKPGPTITGILLDNSPRAR
jgi:hypothetical protein